LTTKPGLKTLFVLINFFFYVNLFNGASIHNLNLKILKIIFCGLKITEKGREFNFHERKKNQNIEPTKEGNLGGGVGGLIGSCSPSRDA
jgi:hypothetical protein